MQDPNLLSGTRLEFAPGPRRLGHCLQLSRLAAPLLALFVAACGGGGGGDGGSEPPAPPVATTSGLVPAPPPLGETLEADATVLRPLAAGASWQYHGVLRRLSSEVALNTYANSKSQSAQATGFAETQSNAANTGVDTSTLRVNDGRIEVPIDLELPGRAPESLVGIELRSPVRVGDQYVSFDRRIADIPDRDGDGRADALDAALYARVIGRELVELPTLPAVQAVRVEFTTAVRVRFSRDGSTSPVDLTVQRIWYARGLGVVRMQLEEDSDVYLSRVLTEEWLVAHNRAGLVMGPGPTVISAQPGGLVSSLSSTWRAPRQDFTWSDGVLMVFQTEFARRQLTSFDRNGQLVFDQEVSAVLRNGVQAEDGVAFFQQDGTVDRFLIHAIDRSGRFVGPAAGVTAQGIADPAAGFISLGFTVTSWPVYANRQLWLSYKSEYLEPGTNNRFERNGLRGVDVTTGALATPFVDLGVGNLPASPMLVAGGVLYQVRSLIEGDGSKTLRLLTLPIAPLGSPRWQVLANGLAASASHNVELAALANGGVLVVWKNNYSFSDGSSAGPWSGVQVRPDGRVLRNSATGGDRLSAVPDNFSWIGTRGNRAWFQRREDTGAYLPGQPNTFFNAVIAIDLTPDQPWALAPVQRARVRLTGPAPDGGLFGAFGTFWFDDQVRVLGGVNPQPEGLETRFRWASQPFWLPSARPGT